MLKIKIIIFLLSVILGTGLISIYGAVKKSQGKAECQNEQTKSAVEGVKNHAKAKTKLIQNSDTELVRRYCRFVFDLPYDHCVRTVVPLP